MEEQVGMSCGTCEVPELIDNEDIWSCVVFESFEESGSDAVLSEVIEESVCGNKEGGESFFDGVLSDVFCDHRLTGSVSSDKEDVGSRRYKVE